MTENSWIYEIAAFVWPSDDELSRAIQEVEDAEDEEEARDRLELEMLYAR